MNQIQRIMLLTVAGLMCFAGKIFTQDSTNAPAAAIKPYPLSTCVVSGEKLDTMGKPIEFVYQGQEIKFCCPDCKPHFLKDPDTYMKKIQAAETVRK